MMMVVMRWAFLFYHIILTKTEKRNIKIRLHTFSLGVDDIGQTLLPPATMARNSSVFMFLSCRGITIHALVMEDPNEGSNLLAEGRDNAHGVSRPTRMRATGLLGGAIVIAVVCWALTMFLFAGSNPYPTGLDSNVVLSSEKIDDPSLTQQITSLYVKKPRVLSKSSAAQKDEQRNKKGKRKDIKSKRVKTSSKFTSHEKSKDKDVLNEKRDDEDDYGDGDDDLNGPLVLLVPDDDSLDSMFNASLFNKTLLALTVPPLIELLDEQAPLAGLSECS